MARTMPIVTLGVLYAGCEGRVVNPRHGYVVWSNEVKIDMTYYQIDRIYTFCYGLGAARELFVASGAVGDTRALLHQLMQALQWCLRVWYGATFQGVQKGSPERCRLKANVYCIAWAGAAGMRRGNLQSCQFVVGGYDHNAARHSGAHRAAAWR